MGLRRAAEYTLHGPVHRCECVAFALCLVQCPFMLSFAWRALTRIDMNSPLRSFSPFAMRTILATAPTVVCGSIGSPLRRHSVDLRFALRLRLPLSVRVRAFVHLSLIVTRCTRLETLKARQR
jgi:hypothetical protein